MALSSVFAGQNARPVWRIFSGVSGGFINDSFRGGGGSEAAAT